MSLSKEELLLLMAYVDGEVEDGEMPEARALLARSDAARQIVDQHSAVGEWVRASAERHAVAARADDIADAVMAEVRELGKSKVTSLDRERTKGARSRNRVMAFAALCAVAAGVSLFYLLPQGSGPRSGSNGAPAGPVAFERAPSPAVGAGESAPPAASGEPSAAARIAAADPEAQGIDVQAVESPHHPVSIFYMPAATGANGHASSVVVWIGEE